MTNFSLPLCRLLSFVTGIAIICAAGCESNSGRSAVRGNVSLNGEPVDQGGIAFIPEGEEGGEARLRATGEIRAGQYEFDGRRALYPGKYHVEIYWPKKTGKKVPGESDHPKDETEQVIPLRYNEESELIVDVQPGRNTFDFELKK